MDELIYALGAMAFGMLLGHSVMVQSATVSTLIDQHEVRSQISGIANEVFEDLAARPFDSRTIGATTPVSELSPKTFTPMDEFGRDCDPEVDCVDIDDFHGKILTVERQKLQYKVKIGVRYLDVDDPTQPSVTQSFAKEVVLHIASPHLRKNGQPIIVEVGRVYIYQS